MGRELITNEPASWGGGTLPQLIDRCRDSSDFKSPLRYSRCRRDALGRHACRPSEAVLDILPLPQLRRFSKEDGEPLMDSRGQWKRRNDHLPRAGTRRRGLGTRLYTDLLSLLRVRGVHVAIGDAALPNESSVALHEKPGFERMAAFHRVGFKHGGWVGVAYWQIVP